MRCELMRDHGGLHQGHVVDLRLYWGHSDKLAWGDPSVCQTDGCSKPATTIEPRYPFLHYCTEHYYHLARR